MLTRTVCAKVRGCTPGEYTRRGNSNKPSVLLKSFVPSTLSYETVRNIILKLIPIEILSEYIGFHIWHFLPPLLTAGR
jgi:hypothetical protein